MPSANSAKIEKTPTSEATDFIKQCISLVEKKVRNLEKRKAKLDGYKALSATKELISDQLVALTKYDQVVEMLEQSKEIQKNVQTIYQDYVKQSKKLAKREQHERQQHDVQRIKEVLLLQDILNNMGTDEIRQDFLSGANGAIKLSEKELNQLDNLYKLISPDREGEENSPSETRNFDELLLAASEHITLLLDGKNKEILGTTYKALKDTIMKVHECGYFDQKETKEEEIETSTKEEIVTVSETELPPSVPDIFPQMISQEDSSNTLSVQPLTETEHNSPSQQVNSGSFYIAANSTVTAPSPNQVIFPNQSSTQPPTNQATTQSAAQPQPAALPEVLMQSRGSFNFLQESQVDLESPHMDPAVVAAHPMVPSQMNYQQVAQNEALLAVAAAARTTPSNSTLITPGGPQQADFDPARPIPTQTFTNQNFAAMMTAVPPTAGYSPVPSTPQTPQMPTTVAMLMSNNSARNISASTNLTDTSGYQIQQSETFSKSQSRNFSRNVGNNQQDQSSTVHYQSSDDNDENNDCVQNSYNRNNRGGRGGINNRGTSGSSNGFGRGPRANYSNGRGGNNYYGNRDRSDNFSGSGQRNDNFNSSRRPANSRGGQRGGSRVSQSSGNRGGGGAMYRSQE